MRGLVFVLIVLLAFACNGGEEGPRTATPAPSPSGTAQATATAAPSAEYPPKVSLTENGVYLIRPDGTGLRNLTPGEKYFYSSSWSPDGSRIAVVTSACDAPRISVVDVDSGDAVEVAAFDGGPGGHPGVVGRPLWSPDGRQLAVPAWPYEDNVPYHALLVNADGSGEPVEPFQGLPLGWSPDGKSLAFWARSDEVATLNILDMATRTAIVMDRGWSFSYFAWSPDGQRMAYSVHSTGTGPEQVVVMDPDGENRRVVVEGGSEPAWSPDSKYLAFSEGISPYEWVAVAPADGSQDYVRLALGEEFKWSPRGDAILIRQESSLRLVSLATHQAVDLVSDVLPRLGISFSPDGQRVAFVGSDPDDEDPTNALFVVNTAGTGLQKLARPSEIIGWRFEWSPDGRYIAFQDTIVGSC
jgi:Tol biopolymer transport system component